MSNYVLEVAQNLFDNDNNLDHDRLSFVIEYLESDLVKDIIDMSLHKKIVHILMKTYIETGFSHASLLFVIGKACPITFIKPICKFVKKYRQNLDDDAKYQLLIVIDNFVGDYYKNNRYKKILKRPYMIEFLYLSSASTELRLRQLAIRMIKTLYRDEDNEGIFGIG